jgi:O-antigen/teichoic acid export membrane protein
MFARKTTFILLSDIANAVLSYLALYIITRFIGPGPYGIIAFATGYVALMTIYGDLGFDAAHIKYISSGEDQQQCTSVYFTVKVILTIIGTIFVVLSVFFWKFALTKGFESAENEMIIYIILISTMVKGLAGPFLGVFTALRQMAKYKIAILAGTIARLIGIVCVGLMHLDILIFAFIFVAESSVILGFSAFFFFRSHKLARPTKRYFRSYASFAFPVAIGGIFSIAITNFSPVIIQLCFSSVDVGYYSAALRITGVIGIFTGALGTLLFPTISSMHANGDIESVRNLMFDSERYLCMISFPLVFCAMALSTPIVYIMLSGWMPAAIILQILPLYLLFTSIEQPYSGQLLGTNKPSVIRDKMFMVFCINIGLNILLVPKTLFGITLAGLGGYGAAIALVASSLSGWLFLMMMSRRSIPMKFNKHILVHFGAAGFMAIVIYLLSLRFYISHWYLLAGAGLLYFAGYLAILVLFKEFTKKDLALILQMINIRKLYHYVKDEVKGK